MALTATKWIYGEDYSSSGKQIIISKGGLEASLSRLFDFIQLPLKATFRPRFYELLNSHLPKYKQQQQKTQFITFLAFVKGQQS